MNKEERKIYNNRWYQNHKDDESFKEKTNKNARKRYKQNPERKMKSALKWQKNNPDKVNKRNKKWRRLNPQKASDAKKKWKEKNRDRIRISGRKLYWKNIEKSRKYAREWQRRSYKKNPEKAKMRRRIRMCRKYNAEGSHTLGEWDLLKKQYGYKCPCCRKLEPEIKLTEDHIIPLSKGGSNYIENIQPLCGSCNCKKYTKTIFYLLDTL